MKAKTWQLLGLSILCVGGGMVDVGLWRHDARPKLGTVFAVGKHDLPPSTAVPLGGKPNTAPPASALPKRSLPAWWSSTSSSFRLEMTASSFLFPTDQRLLSVKPNQPVFLLASAKRSLNEVAWQASTGGTVRSDDAGQIWRLDGKTVQMGVFRARQPGVYTVRAVSEGKASVPIPILVGMNTLLSPKSLSSTTASPSLPASEGVLPFPRTMTPFQSGQAGHVAYEAYAVQQGNWIPVSGTVTNGARRITVQLTSAQGGTWTYRLPVSQDGRFAALLRSPFSGQVSLAFVSHWLTQLNQQGDYTFRTAYSVWVPKSLSKRKAALLDSAFMDGNLWPQGVQIAKAIDQAAGGGMAGAMALSTYVSERLHYNVPMGEGKVPYQFEDVSETARSDAGVCMEYAEMLAVLLHDAGIPAQTVVGLVRHGAEHEWVQADVDGAWVPFDPTWNAPIGGVEEVVTNDYALHASHFLRGRTVQEVGSEQ